MSQPTGGMTQWQGSCKLKVYGLSQSFQTDRGRASDMTEINGRLMIPQQLEGRKAGKMVS